jgi:hypothetical protein
MFVGDGEGEGDGDGEGDGEGAGVGEYVGAVVGACVAEEKLKRLPANEFRVVICALTTTPIKDTNGHTQPKCTRMSLAVPVGRFALLEH